MLTAESILLGVLSTSPCDFAKNFVILLCKRYIFISSRKGKMPNILEFQYFFKSIYNEQKYLADSNLNYVQFDKYPFPFTLDK